MSRLLIDSPIAKQPLTSRSLSPSKPTCTDRELIFKPLKTAVSKGGASEVGGLTEGAQQSPFDEPNSKQDARNLMFSV